jgi:hypothetical protein
VHGRWRPIHFDRRASTLLIDPEDAEKRKNESLVDHPSRQTLTNEHGA